VSGRWHKQHSGNRVEGQSDAKRRPETRSRWDALPEQSARSPKLTGESATSAVEGVPPTRASNIVVARQPSRWHKQRSGNRVEGQSDAKRRPEIRSRWDALPDRGATDLSQRPASNPVISGEAPSYHSVNASLKRRSAAGETAACRA